MMKNVTHDYYGRDLKMHCYILSGSCTTEQLLTVSSNEHGLLKGFVKFCQRALDDNLALDTTPSSHIY